MSNTLRWFIALSIAVTGLLGAALSAQEADPPVSEGVDDAAYWTSVFRGETVLRIDVYLTQDKWNTMEPDRPQRRGRGGPEGRPDQAPRRPNGVVPQIENQQATPPGHEPGQGIPPAMPGPMPDASEYEYVPAKVVINGEVLERAGLRFKGNSSYRSSARSMKRPLKIDTNKFVDGQEFHGRTKLNLSISFKDPAYIREKLGYGVYRAAGLPSPGVGWSTVTLHFEDTEQKQVLGPYVVIEQVDKAYMERKFGEEAGNGVLFKPEIPEWRYLGENPSAYARYDIKFGAKNQDMVLRFAQLIRLINEAPDDVFRTQIGSMIDLDMLAGYLAATSLLVNLDSYIGMIHNYYIFIDPRDGRARLLPWDVNEAFGGFGLGAPNHVLVNWSIQRPWVQERPLLKRLFEMAEFRERYRDKIKSLMAGAFTKPRLEALIDKYMKVIAPLVQNTQGPAEVQEMHQSIAGNRLAPDQAPNGRPQRSRGAGGVPALIPFIMARIDSVQAQFDGTRTGEIISERLRGPKRDRRPGRGRGLSEQPRPPLENQPAEPATPGPSESGGAE